MRLEAKILRRRACVTISSHCEWRACWLGGWILSVARLPPDFVELRQFACGFISAASDSRIDRREPLCKQGDHWDLGYWFEIKRQAENRPAMVPRNKPLRPTPQCNGGSSFPTFKKYSAAVSGLKVSFARQRWIVGLSPRQGRIDHVVIEIGRD